MNIQAVTPNYVQNYKNNSVNNMQRVGFTGVRGDEIVHKIVSGANVRPEELVQEMKGTFGIKKDVAGDIMESLIRKVKELFDSNLTLQRKGIENDSTIRTLQSESATAKDRISYLESSVKSQGAVIVEKNKALAEKEGELAALKADFEKYEPMMRVKPLSEIGALTIEDAAKIMDDMVAHKGAALESMHEFLMTGKGQQEALAQIERNNSLIKAGQDGLDKSKEFIEKRQETAENGVSVVGGMPLWFAQRMVQGVIEASPKSPNFHSKAIAEQVKDNAMAFLTPFTDNRWSNTSAETVAKEIEKTIQKAKDNQRYLKQGIEQMKKNNPECEVVIKEVPYDFNNSTAHYEKDGVAGGWQWDFYNLIENGSRRQ